MTEREQIERYRVIIREAITILDKTRAAFKSRDVAQARELLERLVTDDSV